MKLYREDIELILFKIESVNDTYIISDDENIYENINELNQIKGNNPELIRIVTKSENNLQSEYLIIRISENFGSVSSKGEKYIRLAYEIEKIYLSRKKNSIITYFFNQNNARNNLIVLCLILGSDYLYRTIYLRKIIDIKLLLWPIIIWIIILLITLSNPKLNGKIELKRKHEINFLKNNKDKIIVAIIVAILTYLLTTFIKLI